MNVSRLLDRSSSPAFSPRVKSSAAAGTPTFLLSQVVASNYGCSDGGSGLAECSGPVISGAAFDTSVGTHVFTVHAKDNVDNAVDINHPYNVAFNVCSSTIRRR